MSPPEDDLAGSRPPAGGDDSGTEPDDRGTGIDEADADPEEDDEWRFAVEDVGGDADGEGTERAEADDGSIFGPAAPEREAIDPGNPDLENVLFVVLGVVASLAAMAALLGLV